MLWLARGSAFCLAAAALLSIAANAGPDVPQADDIAASVVKVVVSASAPNPVAPWQRRVPATHQGSGVIIPGRRILTNAHVIDHHAAVEVQRAGSAARYTARVEHVCHACDLAILRVADDSFFAGATPVELGTLPGRQDAVEVYGFPVGGSDLSITSGVVSRIEVGTYAHSLRRMLLVQVDSAINPGNSGGPAVVDGRIAGIAMQTIEEADNVGYLVPAPLIRHFLEDVADGRYDGFPELGIEVQTLENPALRRRLALAGRSGGVLVTGVSPTGSARDHIRPGDVLLAMGGLPVDEDGKVVTDGLRLDATVVEHRAQVGNDVEVTLLRGGAPIEEVIPMRPRDPLVERGEGPRYRVFGGLVFQALTEHYLAAFETIPAHLAGLVESPLLTHGELGKPAAREDREEVVVLTGVLANGLTRGYEGFEDEVVYAVDGVRVHSLEHLSRLLDEGTSELADVVLERGGVLSVPRDAALAHRAEILARYGVSSDRSPDLRLPADLAE